MWLGSFAWFACWLARFAWLICFALLAWFIWLVGWLGWSVVRLISCLIGWPAGWLASLPPLLAQILFHCNSEVEHNDFEISSARKFLKRFPWKILKLSMIYSKASLPVCFRNLLDHPPTWPESETHMILHLQAKVHGLGYLGVSTCTYPIFSEFKAPFWIPSSLPSSLTINFCTVVATAVAALTTTINNCYSRSYVSVTG